jgi:hypothetical protein
MNANFTLDFGNKNLYVIFNAQAKEDKVAPVKIGLQGQSFKSASFANALLTVMNQNEPRYAVTGPGMYLHQTLDDIALGLGTQNGGYLLTAAAREAIQEGKLTYRNELQEGSLYRVRYEGGLGLPYISAVVVTERVEGESDYADHNRHAYYLIDNLEKMRKAETKGINIQLFWTEKEAPLFEFLAEVWDLFVKKDFDAIAEKSRNGINKQKVYKTLKVYAAIAKKASDSGSPLTAPEGYMVITTEGETMDPNELVGKTIRLVASGLVLPFEHDVTELNVAEIARAIKAQGLKVLFVSDAPAVSKPRKAAGKKVSKKAE